jgi:hypothetical protein
MPRKPARAVAHLKAFLSKQAGLYCSPQIFVNENLCLLRLSPIMGLLAAFRNALVEQHAAASSPRIAATFDKGMSE